MTIIRVMALDFLILITFSKINTTFILFYDLNTKFSYNPSDKDIISISMYNGEDNLDSSRKNNNTFGSNIDGERSITTDIKDLLN